MESSNERIAKYVIDMGKQNGAAFINAECIEGQPPHVHLNGLLDTILNPKGKIDDAENIEWCKWLIAGGRTPEEFAKIGEFKSNFNC